MDHELQGGAFVCFVLAAMATVVALVPRWRNSWGWGRGGSAGPISTVGWTGIILGLLAMGAGIQSAARAWFDSFFSLLMVLGGFALTIAAAVFDSVLNERNDKKRPHGRKGRGGQAPRD